MVPRPSFHSSSDDDIIFDDEQQSQPSSSTGISVLSVTAAKAAAAAVLKQHTEKTIASAPKLLSAKEGKLRQRKSLASFPVREIRFERLHISKQTSVVSTSSTATTSASTVTTTSQYQEQEVEQQQQQHVQVSQPQHPNTALVEAKQRERFAIFMKILFKLIAGSNSAESRTLQMKAKKLVTDCTKRNRQGEPKYESLMEVIQVQLRKLVGEKHWMKASVYLKHYYHSRSKSNARSTSATSYTSMTNSVPTPTGGVAATTLNMNNSNHSLRQQKIES